jgi:hypothetical protein
MKRITLPMPPPPIFEMEMPPVTLDLGLSQGFSSMNRKRYTEQWRKAFYWLAVISFGALCAIAAYQIITTEAFLKSH